MMRGYFSREVFLRGVFFFSLRTLRAKGSKGNVLDGVFFGCLFLDGFFSREERKGQRARRVMCWMVCFWMVFFRVGYWFE